MATRRAKEVNPEETREYYQDSYKPSDIITENAEISRLSGTIKRRKGVKRGKQFLNCCRDRPPSGWVIAREFLSGKAENAAKQNPNWRVLHRKIY